MGVFGYKLLGVAMDILVEMHLRKFLQIRKSIMNLLGRINDEHLTQVQATKDGRFVFWDKDGFISCEEQFNYKFAFENDRNDNQPMSVKSFIDSLRDGMTQWGNNNQDIVACIKQSYNTLIGILSNMENTYSPLTSFYLCDNETVYRTDDTGEEHFVTHIDKIPQYIPLTRYGCESGAVDVRTAADNLYLLLCCFDIEIDYQMREKYQQEGLFNEHTIDTTV